MLAGVDIVVPTLSLEEESVVVKVVLDERYALASLRSCALNHDVE
jgi:hypothetical protein